MVKVIKTITCQFCLKEASGSKSHIIPKAFYQEAIRFQLENENRSVIRQRGIYDSNILCFQCEHGVFEPLDNHGVNFFKNGSPQKLGKFLIKNMDDNPKLFQFIVSLFWRASISKLKDFSNFSLNEYEEYFHSILKKNSSEILVEMKKFPVFVDYFYNKTERFRSISLLFNRTECDGQVSCHLILGFYRITLFLEKNHPLIKKIQYLQYQLKGKLPRELSLILHPHKNLVLTPDNFFNTEEWSIAKSLL